MGSAQNPYGPFGPLWTQAKTLIGLAPIGPGRDSCGSFMGSGHKLFRIIVMIMQKYIYIYKGRASDSVHGNLLYLQTRCFTPTELQFLTNFKHELCATIQSVWSRYFCVFQLALTTETESVRFASTKQYVLKTFAFPAKWKIQYFCSAFLD